MAYRRWDYQRIIKREDQINATIKHAKDDLKDIEKKKERIINEEFIKQATAWDKQMTRKRGWFY